MLSRFSSLKRHCCFTAVQLAAKHVQRAEELMSMGKHEDVATALAPLDIALELYPNWEKALELKARVLLYLKRFTDVVELLHDFLPGENSTPECAYSNSPTESPLFSEDKVMPYPLKARGRILSATLGLSPRGVPSKLAAQGSVSLASLRRKLSDSGFGKSEPAVRLGWRYLILGQACCHLGMMEDAMILLQNGKKMASAASRRHSNGMRDDNFCSENSIYTTHGAEIDLVNHMLANIKLLLRRRAAAEAALEAGLYAESVRHFTKIIENQKNTSQGFIADCFLHRAIAYQATGRVVDAIADCNWNLVLNPRCAKALSLRASLHEMVKSFSECLLDLQQLKMIYEASLRQQTHAEWAPSEWATGRRCTSLDTNISGGLDYINSKIATTRRLLCSRTCPLAARTILDLPQHCSMEDVEKAYLLLSLKHSPDKAALFVQNCARQDGRRDMDMVKEEAKASALRLSQLIHKAYTKLLSVISEEEAEEQYERRARECALRRRCTNRKSLLRSHMCADGREEKSLECVESSDGYGYGLADNGNEASEDISDDEADHRCNLDSKGVNTSEEDLAKISDCRISLCNEELNGNNLAKSIITCTEEEKNAEDLYREGLDYAVKNENRGFETAAMRAVNYEGVQHNALHIEKEVTPCAHIKAETRNVEEGDMSNKVQMMQVVMEALTSFKQSAGNVDMEMRAEKMIQAAIGRVEQCCHASDTRTNGELCSQLMMNNEGLLASAISQALSLDSPALLAHQQHWLMSIQDSLSSWTLPISQPLSVT